VIEALPVEPPRQSDRGEQPRRDGRGSRTLSCSAVLATSETHQPFPHRGFCCPVGSSGTTAASDALPAHAVHSRLSTGYRTHVPGAPRGGRHLPVSRWRVWSRTLLPTCPRLARDTHDIKPLAPRETSERLSRPSVDACCGRVTSARVRHPLTPPLPGRKRASARRRLVLARIVRGSSLVGVAETAAAPRLQEPAGRCLATRASARRRDSGRA